MCPHGCGVDGIFVGPYDLSVALGKFTGQFADPQIVAAIDRVLKACQVAGKFSFIYAGAKEGAKKYFAEGFNVAWLSVWTPSYI